jgi:hypothetical protein
MLDENAVVTRVCDFLQQCGYAIRQQRTTTQHGIDIVATPPDRPGRLLVEAKGCTSSRVGSDRSGLAFSPAQSETRVARAMLQAMRLECSAREAADVVAVAFPETPAFVRLLAEVRPLLETHGWPVFWVRDDGTVGLWWPAKAGPEPQPSRLVDGINLSTFDGPVLVRNLRQAERKILPSSGGNYLVLRRDTTLPQFLPQSGAGHFKGKDPSCPISELQQHWVPQAQVLYVGYTDNLSRRIRQLGDFAYGKPVGHWGGRLLWQLSGWEDLEVWWRQSPPASPEAGKEALLARFVATHGVMPYANLRG